MIPEDKANGFVLFFLPCRWVLGMPISGNVLFDFPELLVKVPAR